MSQTPSEPVAANHESAAEAEKEPARPRRRARAAARPKADPTIARAVDEAREAAEFEAKDFGVGDYLGAVVDGERMLTHLFECTHPGYRGWRWAVSMVRASRARNVSVSEVCLIPGDDSLVPPSWVPWRDRLQPGDIAPGTLLPTPDNDPRLEPGYTGGELAADEDPAEWAATRAIVSELGLGRERLLSQAGRDRAAERWMKGTGGPSDKSTKHAPHPCQTCGYFVRLSDSLGRIFGVCTNEYAPFDGTVVHVEHGCGGHSDVVEKHTGIEIPEPVYDTIDTDQSIFSE